MTLHSNSFITRPCSKLPASLRGSFSDDRLLVLKVAVGGRTWRTHALTGALGVLGVLVLYLVQSALGIGLVPGFSFGM